MFLVILSLILSLNYKLELFLLLKHLLLLHLALRVHLELSVVELAGLFVGNLFADALGLVDTPPELEHAFCGKVVETLAVEHLHQALGHEELDVFVACAQGRDVEVHLRSLGVNEQLDQLVRLEGVHHLVVHVLHDRVQFRSRVEQAPYLFTVQLFERNSREKSHELVLVFVERVQVEAKEVDDQVERIFVAPEAVVVFLAMLFVSQDFQRELQRVHLVLVFRGVILVFLDELAG